MAYVNNNPEAGVLNRRVKDVPFENILNFRDVGKTINAFLGEKYVALLNVDLSKATLKLPRENATPLLTLSSRRVAEGRIFRSARPGKLPPPPGPHFWTYLTPSDGGTLSDRKRLKEEYGIKTIMDLRTV
jgi:protein-tyrosine phosphatase